MTPIETKAEAAVQRSRKLANAWPQLAPGQGIAASVVLRALTPLRATAMNILARPVGSPKGTLAGSSGLTNAIRWMFPQYLLVIDAVEATAGGPATPALGYLSGSKVVTEADHVLATHLLQLLDLTLPGLGDTLIGSWQFNLIKDAVHRLLAVATDCDIDTTVIDEAVLLWQSTKEVALDLYDGAKQKTDEGLGVLKVALLVAAGAAGVYAVATARWTSSRRRYDDRR